MGINILNSLIAGEGKLVIIDEVGRLELNNRGWSDSAGKLLQLSSNNVLMTVRDTFLGDVIKKWDLNEAVILKVSECDHEHTANSVLEYIKSGR